MIVDAINAWYETRGKIESAERREKYGGHKIGPSNLNDCLRKQAWLLSGMEPLPLNPETLRTFELGQQRGDRLEAAAKELWPDARTQVPISIPLGKFRMEGTIDLWIPSLRTIVDFKTIGSFGAGLLSEEGVSDDYRLQVHAYRDAIASPWGVDGPEHGKAIRCIVIYECKDSDARKGIKAGQLIELEVPWTEELETKYQNRLRELEGMLIRREQGNLDPTKYEPLWPAVGKASGNVAQAKLDEITRGAQMLAAKSGKRHWKCRYCSIGEERGDCFK